VNLSELRSLDETVVGQLTTADTYVDTMKDQGLEQVKKGKNVAVEFVQNHKLYKKYVSKEATAPEDGATQ